MVFQKLVVVDTRGHLLGRLASLIAKCIKAIKPIMEQIFDKLQMGLGSVIDAVRVAANYRFPNPLQGLSLPALFHEITIPTVLNPMDVLRRGYIIAISLAFIAFAFAISAASCLSQNSCVARAGAVRQENMNLDLERPRCVQEIEKTLKDRIKRL